MNNEKNIVRKKQWVKFRHRIWRNIAYCVLYPYARIRYGLHCEKFREQGNRQYLILYNHQTPFDQFFVGMSFKGVLYYVSTEDILSNGWISKLLRYLVAPIPFVKQTSDIAAVKTCVTVIREGGSIAMAPEGNRTYSGETVYIKPAVAKLIKFLKVPVALYRIEGGYGVEPRWSDVIRKGHVHAYVSRVLEVEEVQSLSDEALYELICKELYVNEARVDGQQYTHKNAAQFLERVIYVCPDCGLSRFESFRDTLTCLKCKKETRYLPTKELYGSKFRFVKDWYDWQKSFINKLQLDAYIATALYEDVVTLIEVILYERKNIIWKKCTLSLFGNRLELWHGDEKLQLAYDDCSTITVLGRNKLNIYYDKKTYQVKGDKRFNALKYMNIFYHYKNETEKNSDEFLGI
ncbi:MAG: 1-acyl-sn-glycerol-3-phosphate acyltransferase [Treponema sp.]|nr:1-acyl-sn-glycerol-3-phosphate acyltransferase [Treponema sp.]